MLETDLLADGEARAPAADDLRATNLRRLRGARNSEALGRLCKINASHLREMEAGRRPVTIKTIDRLAAGLCMTPAQVLAELDGAVLM